MVTRPHRGIALWKITKTSNEASFFVCVFFSGDFLLLLQRLASSVRRFRPPFCDFIALLRQNAARQRHLAQGPKDSGGAKTKLRSS